MRDGNGLQYFLTDHLGSVLAVTDASGTLINEQRYLPFGEVRTDVGEITQTDFGYTFQRGLPGTGLMDYRARFYAPALGRFHQPDSIVPGVGNPQSLNRYSYVGNDPITHIDPSGHWHSDYRDRMNRLRKAYGDKLWFQYRRAYHRGGYSELPVFGNGSGAVESVGGGEIFRDKWWLGWNNGENGEEETGWNALMKTGYSSWELDALRELYNKGGANAIYGVIYIFANDLHITVGSGWQSGGGSRGAWYSGNTIVLNSEAGYSLKEIPNAWGLSLIIHEARHIEQGPNTAFSKFGEMDAWQIGIDVAENLGWYKEKGWNNRDLNVKMSETIDDFTQAIQQNDRGYWNALTGLEWLPSEISNRFCIGLCSLPDWPSGLTW